MRSRKKLKSRAEKVFRLAFQLLIIIWVPFLVDLTALLGSTAPNPSGTKQWVSLLTVFVLYGALALTTLISLYLWKKNSKKSLAEDIRSNSYSIKEEWIAPVYDELYKINAGANLLDVAKKVRAILRL